MLGKRRHVVDIEARGTGEGSRGESLNDWSPVVSNYPAKVEPLRGRDLERARQVTPQATTRITLIRPRAFVLTEEHRIIFRGVAYGIDYLPEDDDSLEIDILGHRSK